MKTWADHEVDTIHTIIQEDAPWRAEAGYTSDSGDFYASWLNAVEQLEAQGTLSAETLRAWWRATEEYQNEWPKWEEAQKPPPTPTPIPPPEARIVGQLRITDQGYADAERLVLPIGIHLGDLFSVYTRDQARAIEALRVSAEAGYALVQFWLNLGTCGDGSYWAGREIGPEITPDYWGQLARFSDQLDAHGLRGIYCTGDYALRSMSHADFARQLGALLAPRDTGALVIAGNEAWQTGADDVGTLKAFCAEFSAVCGDVPITTTCPPSESAEDIAAWCAGDFYAIHGWRDGEDHDRIRHIFGVPWEGRPPTRHGYQDEWTGPGDLVSVKASHCYHGRDVDAHHLCAGAAQSLICNQGFNFFCSDGVKLTDAATLARWQGFAEVPRVVALLPADLMAWPSPWHFGDSQAAHRVFRPGSGAHVRFDHRLSHDGRLVGVLYGDEGHVSILCERPCQVEVVDWDGTVVLASRAFASGQALEVDFVRSQGGQPGRTALLVRGRLT